MKSIFKTCLAAAIALMMGTQLWAANGKTTVDQVTSTRTVLNAVDFIITNATPFGTDGVVDIQNEKAVIILQNVKPSAAIPLLSAHVKVNGGRAINNSNCQVKLYNRGCIILPYGNNTKPLTVYAEKNFEGESADNFGLGNDGGFMNTLTAAQLKNRIRSFKLKRGYMVTFSIKDRGRGYSRCFIADDEDLEFAQLPAILDRSISSYRIFKWYDTGKAALANNTSAEAVSALNVTSCYSFGLGESRLPDAECVPHHIYENWPSAASCGQVTYSCHLKTNNEPLNSADPTPNTQEEILANWEDLMATGMRLCSPSSWDGSDYTNGSGFLKTLLDEIDKRGWRCDIVDLHCYWQEGNFSSVQNWKNTTGRPVWISEWVWGASWNSNGAFASGVTEAQNASAVQRICNTLNNMACVERYYYWNSERDPSKIYKNGSLTAAGKYYASINSGLGYKKSQEYVPKCPPQVAPTNLGVEYDAKTGKATLTWTESNGEMNEYIHLQCRHSSSQAWTDIADVPFDETTTTYTVSDVDAQQGWQFRISEKNANGSIQNSNIVMVVNSDVTTGDAVTIGDETLYIGGNMLVNGDFSMGLHGWTNGKGDALAQPWFQAPAIGGSDGGPYLQCYGNGGTGTESSIKMAVKLKPNTNYYFLADACNMTSSSSAKVVLSTNGTNTNGGQVGTISNISTAWQSMYCTFNSGSNEYVILQFTTLGAQSRFDNLRLYELFSTQEQALDNGAAMARQRAQTLMDYNPQFNSTLTEQLANVDADKQADMDYVKAITDEAIQALATLPLLQVRAKEMKALVSQYPIIGSEQLAAIADEVENRGAVDTTPQWVLQTYEALSDQIEESLPLTTVEGKVKSPNFTSTTGWITIAGTHTGGDQRTATQDGVTCWNAWWALNPSEDNGKTMAIKQELTALPQHGLYFNECRASTQHYCLSDQHAYITDGTTTAVSPTLTSDYLDLTNISVADRWQTLTTLPVYADVQGSVTIGFESSKAGSTDMAYRKMDASSNTGDHREGWWCATDFQLRHLPFYQTTVKAQQWQVACLPYNVAKTPGVTFYQIVGILSDFSALCLEQIDEVEAGEPFIYMSENDLAQFREYGQPKSSANNNGTGNLRGFYTTSATSPKEYYSLIDGRWWKDSNTRTSIGNYHAILRPFNDNQAKPYTLYDTWNGATMPITGITDAEKEVLTVTAIDQPAIATQQGARLYNMNGTPVLQESVRPGVYIKVENGKATKIVIE